jgi:universal stress protein family protein
MFTRLLIGLDGSPNADEALEQAVVLGKRFKAKLVVAHVGESNGAGDLLTSSWRRSRAMSIRCSWGGADDRRAYGAPVWSAGRSLR